MRIEGDHARGDGDDVTTTTKHFDASTDDLHDRGDVEKSTSSTFAKPDDELQRSVVDPTSVMPTVISLDDVHESLGEGDEEVAGTDSGATEDSEEDSDSTTSRSVESTSDELVSDMQNLRLGAEGVDQCLEPLVSRGLLDGTATRWNNDYMYQTSAQWQTTVPTDEAAPNDVRCKRKSICESPVIKLPLQPVEAVTFFDVFQSGTGCEDRTGWDQQQQDQLQATKFRRSGGDPQESDERAHKTCDLSLTSVLTSGILDGSSDLEEPDLLFGFDAQRIIAEDCCPEIGPDVLGFDELPFSRGTLLGQLEEVGAPLATWPNPEITPMQHYQGDVSHVAFSMPATTTTTIIGSDIMTHPSTDMTHGGSAAINSSHGYVEVAAFPSSHFSTLPGSAPERSASRDSGFGPSPTTLRSSLDDFPFNVPVPHHDVPSDVIFDYVEGKLRELVHYVLLRFLRHLLISKF